MPKYADSTAGKVLANGISRCLASMPGITQS
jgi:hypothetical protein